MSELAMPCKFIISVYYRLYDHINTGKYNIALIAGASAGGVGGLLAVIIIILIICYACRKRRKNKKPGSNMRENSVHAIGYMHSTR